MTVLDNNQGSSYHTSEYDQSFDYPALHVRGEQRGAHSTGAAASEQHFCTAAASTPSPLYFQLILQAMPPKRGKKGKRRGDDSSDDDVDMDALDPLAGLRASGRGKGKGGGGDGDEDGSEKKKKPLTKKEKRRLEEEQRRQKELEVRRTNSLHASSVASGTELNRAVLMCWTSCPVL